MTWNKWGMPILSMILILLLAACGGGSKETSPSPSAEKTESTPASTTATAPKESAEKKPEISERTFTFATTMDDSGIDAEIKKKFGEMIAEKSEGKMKVDFFMGGQLGGEKETLEQMKLGELDMGYNVVQADLYYKEYNMSMLPYFFPDYASVKRFMDGPVGEKISQLSKEKGGIIPLGFHGYGPRWTTSNHPFTTPEEMKGVKIRMPEIPWWVEIWESLGALPTPIAAPEIVTALKTGTVDAQENFLTNIAGRKMWEYQKYLIATEHIELFQTWLISDKTWQSLNEAEQKIIQDSVSETIAYILPKIEEMNKGFIKESEENGMEIIYPDREAFMKVALEANKKIIGRDLAPGVYEEAVKAIENK
jgi:tripartite ATP-independent transporter DctP family solute receptor